MKSTTPDEYLASLSVERRGPMLAVHAAIGTTAPKLAPEMMRGMGSSIIGCGKYRYKSASGHEGDWFLIGLTVKSGGINAVG
jgi:hypothetical protein